MDEAHHRSIIDHLELNSAGHHLQEDLSKGVLRTIHNVENGTLHFITIPPATNSREQEYIESSLLGADLLSSHIPNGLLVDYITTSGSPATGSQFHPQTNLLDHHGGIQTYTAEDLQTLVDASTMQTVENDRKLFLQFVNKPATQMSHEAPVIVTNPKDISTVNALSDHDKLTQSTHSQLTNVNHLPTATSGSSFLHYHHQNQLFTTAHTSVDGLVSTANVLANHHGMHQHNHHHHPHHHVQTIPQQIIHNTAQQPPQHQSQQQPQPQQQAQAQQSTQSQLSSIHTMLPNDCSQSKLFHVASSTANVNIPVNSTTDQNCIQIPPLTPIKRVESPKRYINYQMVQIAGDSAPQTESLPENFMVREELIDCEPRTDDEEESEAANNLVQSTNFVKAYLPHKKRLAKKLGDAKSVKQNEQLQRSSVISHDHYIDHSKNTGSILEKERSSAFSCQLCTESFDDQLTFFTHLKGHYEPAIESPTHDGKSGDPKKKPKLPRVKHTKKLKNDKSSRITTEDETMPGTIVSTNQQIIFEAPKNSQLATDCNARTYQQNPVQSDIIVCAPPQQAPATLCNEPENAGEFSENEDMLEGIRNVVQKVQEAVDTDTNDGLNLQANRTLINADNKTWYANERHPVHANPVDMAKVMDFAGDLDAHEIHINAGNENFVLFLNKADFQPQDAGNQPPQQQQPPPPPASVQSTNSQTLGRHVSNIQQHTMLPGQLQTNHNTAASYLLDTDNQLQHHTINDCDMNMQILGLNSSEIDNNEIAKLVDFNLTSQLSELSTAKFDHLKHERESAPVDATDSDEGFYLSEDEEEIDEGTGKVQHDDSQQHAEYQNDINNVHQQGAMQTFPPVPPPHKKRGRRKDSIGLYAAPDGKTSLKRESKKYPCTEPDCDKIFNSKTAVRYHELQHKNERPYRCSQCPKNFFTSSALKVHERLHSGEKPYKCDDCGRAFRQWGDMKYHQSSIHSNEKTHQCEFCGKKFARRYSLVLHRKIHLNEKNHICDICNKAFRASSYLQSHRMIHTGEKPYSCSVCCKKFRCGGDMKRHLKTHERSKSSPNKKQQNSRVEDSTSQKVGTKIMAGGKSSSADVIDLTKIKNEGSKINPIQTPAVVTVLTKDINQVGHTSKLAISGGQAMYLTPNSNDHYRKPDDTVLMGDTRWS